MANESVMLRNCMLTPKPYLREISLKPEKVLDATKYPFTIPAVRHLDGLKFDLDVTFLIGENGAGKSTLLEAISVALGFNAEGGTKNFKFSTRASQSELHTCLRLVRSFQRPRDGNLLRAESFFKSPPKSSGSTRNRVCTADHRFVWRAFIARAVPRGVVLSIDDAPLPRQGTVYTR